MGVTKQVLNKEVVNKVYDQALSPTVKVGGEIGADLMKTFRLFLAPFQLSAMLQDRFQKWLDIVRDSVPEENQIECPPSVAGPIIEQLKYIEDDNYLRDIF